MTLAHGILLCVALLMAGEAGWAVIAPLSMRDRVRRMLDETKDETRAWHILFWGCAALMWLFAWHGQTWAHRALFLIGVFFFAAGWFACRTDFVEKWYACFLGNRSATTIRLLYLTEALIAAGLGFIALKAW